MTDKLICQCRKYQGLNTAGHCNNCGLPVSKASDKLNEADCKRLTEFLGECWHEYVVIENTDMVICRNCRETKHIANRTNYTRTFTTPSDQHAVFSKLVEVGKWEGFLTEADYGYRLETNQRFGFGFYAWLWISPERFCKLASLYLEEEK